mmetsp:Transcript_11909/g.20090  ORF Transcript_11909/g.20090 Transcript_11909/m.20090 type:complete len:93 (+) Transcript_11909:2183-2461(+)
MSCGFAEGLALLNENALHAGERVLSGMLVKMRMLLLQFVVYCYGRFVIPYESARADKMLAYLLAFTPYTIHITWRSIFLRKPTCEDGMTERY